MIALDVHYLVVPVAIVCLLAGYLLGKKAGVESIGLEFHLINNALNRIVPNLPDDFDQEGVEFLSAYIRTHGTSGDPAEVRGYSISETVNAYWDFGKWLVGDQDGSQYSIEWHGNVLQISDSKAIEMIKSIELALEPLIHSRACSLRISLKSKKSWGRATCFASIEAKVRNSDPVYRGLLAAGHWNLRDDTAWRRVAIDEHRKGVTNSPSPSYS